MLKTRSLLLLLPVLFSGLFAFNSCEKKVFTLDPNPPEEIPDKTFTATVDGIEFIDTVLWGEENVAGGTLTVTASMDGGYPRIILILPNNIIEGNHKLGETTSTSEARLEFGPLPVDHFVADTGQLWITRHDTFVDFARGSFEFIAVGGPGNPSLAEFEVTGGKFVISY